MNEARLKIALRYVAGRSLTHARALLAELDGDLAGLSEVARAAGKGKTEVSNRTRRPDFPEPIVRLACGPIYSRIQTTEYLSRNSDESDGMRV